MKPRGKSHDLAVKAVEAMVAAGFAGIAFLFSTADPGHARAAGRPFDEWLDPGNVARQESAL